MSLPDTDLDWVDYLSRRHDAEKPELEMLDRYYEGTQPLTYMHPELLREVGERIQPVIIAWPQLVVDSVEERLDVEGFKVADEGAADDDLWRVWRANGLDVASHQGHVDALVMRRSYVCVGTNERDPDTPLITVESPLEVYADIDPRTRRVRAALRRVDEGDSVVRISERYATLYLPDRTIWYRWDGGWREEARDEHGLGEPPVVPLVNRPRLRAGCYSPKSRVTQLRHGRSELAPIVPLSDAANKMASDMMVAGEFVAIPPRGILGIGPDQLEDEQGNRLTAFQAIMGRLLMIPDEGGAAKTFEFTAAQLANFTEAIGQLARLVASISGLPPDYLGLSTDNPPSAESRLAGEIRLIKRAERKQRAFGAAWTQVMRLVRRIQSGDWDPRLQLLETDWRDASTPTIAQKADAAIKLYTAPPGQRPIVPLRQTREDLGYSNTQIARMEAEDAREAEQDPLAALARAQAGGSPAAIPVEE